MRQDMQEWTNYTREKLVDRIKDLEARLSAAEDAYAKECEDHGNTRERLATAEDEARDAAANDLHDLAQQYLEEREWVDKENDRLNQRIERLEGVYTENERLKESLDYTPTALQTALDGLRAASEENERLKADMREMLEAVDELSAENERLEVAVHDISNEREQLGMAEIERLQSRLSASEDRESYGFKKAELAEEEIERLSHCDADDSHLCAIIENKGLRARLSAAEDNGAVTRVPAVLHCTCYSQGPDFCIVPGHWR